MGLAEKTGSGRVHISFKLSKRKVGELQTKRKKVSLLFATKLRKKALAQELPSEGESWNKTLPEYVEQLHKDWLKANKPKAELSSAQIEQHAEARAWSTHWEGDLKGEVEVCPHTDMHTHTHTHLHTPT